MRRGSIAITVVVGAALLGFAVWCIALLSEVSQLRVEVERRVHWLADIHGVQAELSDPGPSQDAGLIAQQLSDVGRDLLTAHAPADPVVVGVATATAEVRGLGGPDDAARRASAQRSLGGVLVALRADNARLSAQLGARWLYLEIVAVSAIVLAAGLLALLGHALLVTGPRLRADAARLASLSVRLEQASLAGRGVGHELGGPITAALTTLQVLRDELRGAGESREDHLRMLELAIVSLNRATGTLQDLRASSDSGEDQTTDVHAALDDALAETRFRHSGASRVTVDAERVGPVALPQPVVRRLFARILGDAVDASPGSGTIVVRTRQERALISVEFGVARAAGDDEPFRDVSRALSVLGGRLSVLRRDDCEVVRVELPRRGVDVAPAPEVPDPTPAPAPAPAAVRILLIDDDDSVLASVSRVLARHAVVQESDAERAIERAIAGDFDLILCDMMMPKKSGLEVFAAVTAARPEMAKRFAFMSGGSVEPEIVAALDHAAFRIDKPFGAEELRRLVQRFASA